VSTKPFMLHSHVGSMAANRFVLPDGEDLVIEGKTVVIAGRTTEEGIVVESVKEKTRRR
jgi:hypothetical protein